MDVEDRIKQLEEKYNTLKLRLNHASHPPHINQILDYIRKKTVATMDELRTKFPLYGGNLSRLYKTLREMDAEFVVIPGTGRKARMVVAHLNEGKPATFSAIAVHIFSETRKGGLIPLEKIRSTYDINEDDAKQVYDTIIHLFKARIITPSHPQDKYQKPIKRLY